MAKFKELGMGAGNPKPVEIRPIVSEFSLRISCRTVFYKAFLHFKRFPSSEPSTGLHPQTFRRLEEETTKLLATTNIPDIIGPNTLRLVLGQLDVQGINARWKDVNILKERYTNDVLERNRKHHVPSGSVVAAEESAIDFVETLLRLSEDGKYTATAI